MCRQEKATTDKNGNALRFWDPPPASWNVQAQFSQRVVMFW